MFLCFIFIVLNLLGIKGPIKTQKFFVFGLFSILCLYTIKGIPNVEINHFKNFIPHGIHSVLLASGFVFISYGGLIKVASIAEEVRKPEATIPLAMILSLLATSILYTLVVFVTIGVLPSSQIHSTLTPISDGAEMFMGQKWHLFTSLCCYAFFYLNGKFMHCFWIKISNSARKRQPSSKNNKCFKQKK